MNRASAVDLRKALDAAQQMVQAGILFVPMPVSSREEQSKRIDEADARLEQMAVEIEAQEKTP